MVRYFVFNQDWKIKRYLASTVRRRIFEETRILGITLGPGLEPDQILRYMKPDQLKRLEYLEASEPLSSTTFNALRRQLIFEALRRDLSG